MISAKRFSERKFELWMASLGIVALSLSPCAYAQESCDPLASKLFRKPIQRALDKLDCSLLGKAGIDNSSHRLNSLCYSSNGQQSKIDLDVTLSCKTGKSALFKVSLSETVHGTVEIDGANCRASGLVITSSGEFGRTLLQQFDVQGLAFKALQAKLDEACAP